MEQLLKEIMPAGPIRFVILAMALFYYAYPQVRKYWYEHRFRSTQVDLAIKELQLLKLRYEIEAFAKEKDLPSPTWPDFLRLLPLLDTPPQDSSQPTKGIRPLLRFFYAALGSLIPLGYRFTILLFTTSPTGLGLVGFLLGIVTLMIVAGLLGIGFGRESPARSIIIGAFTPLAASSLMSFFIQQ